MFIVWLLEQEYREDSVSRLTKLILKDYNNGCLPAPKTVKGVLTHFMDDHPSRFQEVQDLFVDAIRAYDKEVEK